MVSFTPRHRHHRKLQRDRGRHRASAEVEKLGMTDESGGRVGNLLVQIGHGPAIGRYAHRCRRRQRPQWARSVQEKSRTASMLAQRGDPARRVPPVVPATKVIRTQNGQRGMVSTAARSRSTEGGLRRAVTAVHRQRGHGIRLRSASSSPTRPTARSLRGQRRAHGDRRHRSPARAATAPCPKGDNAVYKVGQGRRRDRRTQQAADAGSKFLGNGTICRQLHRLPDPQPLPVPGRGAHPARLPRLTTGDTAESAIREVKDAVKRAGVEGREGRAAQDYAESALHRHRPDDRQIFPHPGSRKTPRRSRRRRREAHSEALQAEARPSAAGRFQHERRLHRRDVRASPLSLRAGGGGSGALTVSVAACRSNTSYDALRSCRVSGDVRFDTDGSSAEAASNAASLSLPFSCLRKGLRAHR